jgi:hypothetical protein
MQKKYKYGLTALVIGVIGFSGLASSDLLKGNLRNVSQNLNTDTKINTGDYDLAMLSEYVDVYSDLGDQVLLEYGFENQGDPMPIGTEYDFYLLSIDDYYSGGAYDQGFYSMNDTMDVVFPTGDRSGGQTGYVDTSDVSSGVFMCITVEDDADTSNDCAYLGGEENIQASFETKSVDFYIDESESEIVFELEVENVGYTKGRVLAYGAQVNFGSESYSSYQESTTGTDKQYIGPGGSRMIEIRMEAQFYWIDELKAGAENTLSLELDWDNDGVYWAPETLTATEGSLR